MAGERQELYNALGVKVPTRLLETYSRMTEEEQDEVREMPSRDAKRFLRKKASEDHDKVLKGLVEAKGNLEKENEAAPPMKPERPRTFHGPGVTDLGEGGVLIDVSGLVRDEVAQQLPTVVATGGGEDGDDGEDGLQIELQSDGTYIQWRYFEADPADTWKNLVLLTDLKGADGDPGTNGTNGLQVELRADVVTGYIQWRYADATPEDTWNNLVLITDLKGDKGDPGDSLIPNGSEGDLLRWESGAWVLLTGFTIEPIQICVGGVPTDYEILARLVTP